MLDRKITENFEINKILKLHLLKKIYIINSFIVSRNMATKDQINQNYINEKVNPLLEKLVIDLLIHKPENSVIIFFWFSQKKFS